jgi:hypothetical protein
MNVAVIGANGKTFPIPPLFRDCLSFDGLADWQVAAYWITSLQFRPGPTMSKCGRRT